MKHESQSARTRTWVVLTFGDDRQHAGNTGYDDDPRKWYSYDSYVANHRQIADGDFLIVCDRVRALGIAQVTRIDSVNSTRRLLRCPICSITGIKARQSKSPLYRCKSGHEFDNPVQVETECTKFTALFGDSFIQFQNEFGRDFLRQGCPRYSDQLAMQEFEFRKMEESFRTKFPEDAHLIQELTSLFYLPATSAKLMDDSSSYKPRDSDERELILRQIRARRGQQAFRDMLRQRYGDRCMISGSTVLHVLEAAHICPYRGEDDNHPENGLLLRADLHTLFDLDLVGIEPNDFRIHFNPAVISGGYRQLDGCPLMCPEGIRPNRDALLFRWRAFEERAWKTV